MFLKFSAKLQRFRVKTQQLATRIMPYLGHIDPYDGVEPLDAYLQRLEAFFDTNDIGKFTVPDGANEAAKKEAKKKAEEKKVSALVTLIGKQTYGVLQDLCKPDLPRALKYDELVKKLEKHYRPVRLDVAESFKFHRCVQSETESVTEYSTRLRGAATYCNFGAFLLRALRDQFVCGVRSKDIQKKLLETDRDFQACIDVAEAAEAAAKESANLTDSFQSPISAAA